jgi:hypothetical protein
VRQVQAAGQQVGCFGQEREHPDPAFLGPAHVATAERECHPAGHQPDPVFVGFLRRRRVRQ